MRGSRNRVSEAVISALLRDFSKHGEKAIAKVRRTHPAAYLKCLALLVPREHKVEHSNPLKAMSDEELDEALDSRCLPLGAGDHPQPPTRPLQRAALTLLLIRTRGAGRSL